MGRGTFEGGKAARQTHDYGIYRAILASRGKNDANTTATATKQEVTRLVCLLSFVQSFC